MLDIVQTALIAIVLVYLVRQRPVMSVATPTSKKGMILDTCALIDARIVDVARAGFTPKELIVPRFVINELQLLADGADAHKRERARFGLDMVAELQNSPQVELRVSDQDFTDIQKTDDKLVRLAKKLSADLCTTDYNLNKVATIEGVRILNVNELANAVRPVILPGEKREIKIVQRGSNRDQGVGYLEDGTMVVVSGAGQMVGKKTTVEVTRMLQSDAGKMLFAKKLGQSKPRNNNQAR
jgi:uncharacterized protein YacL